MEAPPVAGKRCRLRAVQVPRTVAEVLNMTRVALDAGQHHHHHPASPTLSRSSHHADGGRTSTDQVIVDGAATLVDLSGTWRPILSKEFRDGYDAFLRACGEPYWTRKLVLNALAMYTLVIRQRQRPDHGNTDDRGGGDLELLDVTPIGSWNRTLVSSPARRCASPPSPINGTLTSSNKYNNTNNHHGGDIVPWDDIMQMNEIDGVYVNELIDPQGDPVQIVSYWCEGGTVHQSFLKSAKPRFQDVTFETRRYLMEVGGGGLDEEGSILVCESIYHPVAPSSPPTSARNEASIEDDRGRVSVVWKFRRDMA